MVTPSAPPVAVAPPVAPPAPTLTVIEGPPTNILAPDARLPIETGGTAPAEAQTTRVAVLLPRSGRHASLGEAMWNAAQLALFDFAEGRFELVPYDTAGDPAKAAQAAQRAVAEGSRMIIGPLLSGSTREVGAVARDAGVPVLSFSSDSGVAGSGVFVMGFTPQAEVERVMRFAHDRGLSRFAVITPDNAFGAVIARTVRDTAAELGDEVVRIEMVNPNSQDFSAVVERLAPLRAGATSGGSADPAAAPAASGGVAPAAVAAAAPDRGFQALMIAELGSRVGAIAAYLPSHGIDGSIRILGTGTWDQPRIGSEQALVGGWFASADPVTRAGFESSYQGTYGNAPPRLASLAYDATALAAVLSRTYGAAGFDTQLLTAPGGFYGSDGLFRFGADGVVERGLAILEVDVDGARIIDPAPSRFSPLAGS